MEYFPCSGFTIESILRSNYITRPRKDMLITWFKHVVRESFYTKGQILRPDKFLWDNNLLGNVDGVITSGVGDNTQMDQVVHVSPPLLPDNKFATIKDVTCTNLADKEDTVCVKCRPSREQLVCRFARLPIFIIDLSTPRLLNVSLRGHQSCSTTRCNYRQIPSGKSL